MSPSPAARELLRHPAVLNVSGISVAPKIRRASHLPSVGLCHPHCQPDYLSVSVPRARYAMASILVSLSAIALAVGAVSASNDGRSPLVPFLKRQAPGTPEYNCHDNCGEYHFTGSHEGS